MVCDVFHPFLCFCCTFPIHKFPCCRYHCTKLVKLCLVTRLEAEAAGAKSAAAKGTLLQTFKHNCLSPLRRRSLSPACVREFAKRPREIRGSFKELVAGGDAGCCPNRPNLISALAHSTAGCLKAGNVDILSKIAKRGGGEATRKGHGEKSKGGPYVCDRAILEVVNLFTSLSLERDKYMAYFSRGPIRATVTQSLPLLLDKTGDCRLLRGHNPLQQGGRRRGRRRVSLLGGGRHQPQPRRPRVQRGRQHRHLHLQGQDVQEGLREPPPRLAGALPVLVHVAPLLRPPRQVPPDGATSAGRGHAGDARRAGEDEEGGQRRKQVRKIKALKEAAVPTKGSIV